MNLRKLQKLYRRNIQRVVATRGRLPSVFKSFIAALVSFTLVVTWGGPAWGQIPFLTLLEGTNNDKPIVDFFNRPYKCGNLVCTQIWFTGMPILEIASEPTTEDGQESSFRTELRAKRIQNNLQQILRTTIDADSADRKTSKVTERLKSILPPIADSQEPVGNSKLGQATEPAKPQPTTPKPETAKPETQEIVPLIPYWNKNSSTEEKLHDNTPQIEIGTLNGETVVFYIPKEKELPNVKIMTVTRADVVHHDRVAEALAQRWRERIRSRFSFALAERELEAQTPLLKPAVIGGLVLLMILLGLAVGWLQKRTRDRYKNLKAKLRELEASLAIDPESASTEQLAAVADNENPEATEEQQPAKAKNSEENTTNSATTNSPAYLTQQLGSLWRNFPKFSLKKHSVLKQQQNLTLLLLQVFIWVQALILVWGTALIFGVYPSIRAIGYLLLVKTFPIIGIWVLITLADKISNFLIDSNLNAWAENAQLTDQSSPRYALRVSTYSAALNNLSSVIFWLIGIIWTAEILGIATTVLASAGIIAVIVTYFSQNLVRDAINGLLILLTDRYAVGDVILVDDVGGLVERMNLYMTQLRSADGEYITIPNGSITVVRNLTKDWSRVNLTIEVGYDADIKKALQVLRQVAEEFYADPEWREHLVEPIEVLGIDDISHAGMLVRIWLKTQPIKQWLVGRGFRLRVKEAFDREGIAIGIPQRSLSVKNYTGLPNTNGKGKEQDKVSNR